MVKNNPIITVEWEDARFYHFFQGQKISLTPTKCYGELIKKNKDFVILKNCQQFVRNKDKFILKRKANFFYIPNGMIFKILT